MKLFDLSLKLAGFPIGKAQRYFDEILRIPENEYEEYINQKKAEIVNFHLKNNSFYRELCKDKNTENWNDLPVLTKADLQQPLARRLSDGFTEKNVFVNKTSGSSGIPFVFARDKFCHALTWSSIMWRFKIHKINLNQSYQARFYGMPLHGKAHFMIRIKDYFSNRYRLSISDFSDEGIEKILNHFRRKSFQHINGYTTCIVQIALYLKKKNLVLHELCPTLKFCVTTSEMLLETDRILIEKHIGVPVLNEYGSAEVGIIALENKDLEWCLNQEDLFVEILDDTNNPVPDAVLGNIVITSFFNKAHPFIRYKVGDLGSVKSISAKKKILVLLQGRTNDFALLPSGKKAAGMTFYSLTKAIMDNQGIIKEFRIIQKKLDCFTIEYSSEVPLSNEKIKGIEAKFDEYLETGLKYEFVYKNQLDRTKNGKLKQFESAL
ncbi:phenylacetate--CoA ligase family protein [Flavobacterium antarcticum]|uniref:phenylacetate--CoA ligase family protein n=1 Tax=Flavobacterium antarcticum TaxID=271155 RepID=UPI0003B450B7|nr:phenylacetate--CoA ligase family protein [Flavobacterium antarcticum]